MTKAFCYDCGHTYYLHKNSGKGACTAKGCRCKSYLEPAIDLYERESSLAKKRKEEYDPDSEDPDKTPV